MLFPAFSMLRAEAVLDPARVLLLSLKRAHLMPWARIVMALALGRRRHQDLPPMLWQRETDSVWHQICERPMVAGERHGGKGSWARGCAFL